MLLRHTRIPRGIRGIDPPTRVKKKYVTHMYLYQKFLISAQIFILTPHNGIRFRVRL